MKVDLHLHTTHSDGVLDIPSILKLAKEHDYTTLSITDHDTLSGSKIALSLAKKYGINIIPGVEISSIHKNKDIHILAYFVDVANYEFENMLNKISKGRYLRAQKIIERLRTMGIKLEFDTVLGLAGKANLIGRPHIARALIDAGYCTTKWDVFDRFLGDECPAFVPKPSPDTEDVIKLVKKMGGITSIAHPHKINNDLIVQEIIEMGVDGLEVFYSKSDENTIRYYNKMAQKNGLLRTGGTDFHGDGFEMDTFGSFSVPLFVLEEMILAKEEMWKNLKSL